MAECYAHPDFLARLPNRGVGGVLAEIDVAAGKRPFADCGFDTAANQQQAARFDDEASRDQLRSREQHEAASRANFALGVLGHQHARLHRGAAQRTKFYLGGIVALHAMVCVDGGVFLHAVRRRTSASPISRIIAATSRYGFIETRRSSVARSVETSAGEGLRRPPVADASFSSRP